MITLRVYGNAAPQGSKSAFRNKHTGRIQQVESSKAVKPWRQDVRSAAQDALPAGHTPLAGPLSVELVFTFDRPQGHWRTGRNAHLLRDSAPAYPAGSRNDVDKLARAVLDAVTSAGLWGDDGQVVHLDAWKVYVGHPAGLDRPGCLVTISDVAGGGSEPGDDSRSGAAAPVTPQETLV